MQATASQQLPDLTCKHEIQCTYLLQLVLKDADPGLGLLKQREVHLGAVHQRQSFTAALDDNQ